MIEVLFADSEAASMKAAKSTVIYSRTDGPTSVFIAGKRNRRKRNIPAGWKETPMMLSVLAIGWILAIYGRILKAIIGKI